MMNETAEKPPAERRMWFHLQHARWVMNGGALRDAIDRAIYTEFGTPEVPGVSPLPSDREGAVR